jgi:hypothetical protein
MAGCMGPRLETVLRTLSNEAGETAATVQRRFDGLLGAMARHRANAGPLPLATGGDITPRGGQQARPKVRSAARRSSSSLPAPIVSGG